MTPEERHDHRLQRLEARARSPEAESAELLDLAEACFQKGYYYGRGEGWYARARQVAMRALDADEGIARGWNVLANAAYGLGDLEEAERCYVRAIDVAPDDALAYVGLGNLHKQNGHGSRAIDAFQKAVELDPELWQAHYNLGGALYAEAKERDWKGVADRMERAIYHLVTSLRLRPFDGFLGNIYKDLGELFLHTHQHKHAHRLFQRLLDHPEYQNLAHYYLGLTHFAMGNYAHAVHHYKEFLRADPDSAVAWSKIGLCWLELGEWDKAREACEQALMLEPLDTLARFTLACIDLDQRLFAQAEGRLESLLADEPEYFAAWVELVRTHDMRGDYGWLFDSLKAEVQAFEDDGGLDGGREFYKGSKGRARRRIDVLLAQIQEVGVDAFASLAEIVEEVHTDSLRFQIWEQLYDMSRKQRVAHVIDQLAGAPSAFGKELGRNALLLGQFLPEEALFAAWDVGEDAIRRRAAERRAPGQDVADVMRATEEVRGELREFQSYLLLALSTKGTPAAEDFLQDRLDLAERELRMAAAIALLFYGNQRAIELLDEETSRLAPAAGAKLRELIEIGRDRQDHDRKVLPLDEHRRRPRAARATHLDHCTLCGRASDLVERLMTGERVHLCNLCVRYLHQHRSDLIAAEREDQSCSFCGGSAFDVQAMVQSRDLLVCGGCLDDCVGLLAREEVERYLAGLG